MSGEPSLAIWTIIRDDLAADSCLPPMLETEGQVRTHGSQFCDQPVTSHEGQPFRRYQRPMPAHFTRAVVAFGRLQPSQHSPSKAPWIQDWVFLAGAWARKDVTQAGETYSGDVYAGMIHDHVVRILAWDQKRSGCDWDVQVMHRQHDGTIEGPQFDTIKGYWLIISQFRWTVAARGLLAPAEVCCV